MPRHLAVGGVHDAVVGERRVPERKSALMVRGEADLFRAERHGGPYPLICAEVGRVEHAGGDALRGVADAVVLDAGPRVDREMHELG